MEESRTLEDVLEIKQDTEETKDNMEEQSELYFSDVEYVKVKWEIPNGGL